MKYIFKVTYRPGGNVKSGVEATIIASCETTLYELHEAMLDAFGLMIGKGHGFFMDNRAFSQSDAYYDEMIETLPKNHARYPEYRHTKDYRLGDSNLVQKSRPLMVGDKFRYAYNFSEEWVWMIEVVSIEAISWEWVEILEAKGADKI